MNNRIPKIPKMKIEELLEKLKDEFKIGHWDPKEEVFTPRGAFNMYSIYRTLSPQQFESFKCGLNYDYTEYLAWYFTTYFNSTFFELYYIEFDDGYNYTFLIYQDQYGYHLVIPGLALENIVQSKICQNMSWPTVTATVDKWH